MKKLIFFFIAFFMLASCVEEMPIMTIPYAPVFFKVDLNGLDSNLKGALSTKSYTERNKRTDTDKFGYAGILLVRNATDKDIYAYDLCCPYDVAEKIQVKPDINGEAVCPKCKSIYVTMYGRGDVKSGPSKKSLQTYHVRKDKMRENVFYIVN